MADEYKIKEIEGDQTRVYDIDRLRQTGADVIFESTDPLMIGLNVNFVIVTPENDEWPLFSLRELSWRLSVDETTYIRTYQGQLWD